MSFNYFNSQSYVGINTLANTDGIGHVQDHHLNALVTGGHVYYNTGSQTWTCPGGVITVCILVIAGGGGGMYYNYNNSSYQ